MNLAVNSRDLGFDHGNNAAGVQMPPLAWPMIVRRAFETAFRAGEPGQRFMLKPYSNFGFFHSEIHVTNAPRGLQPEQLLVEFFILHKGRISYLMGLVTLPTQKSEAPKINTYQFLEPTY
jgi:hypothetical protein